MTSPVEALELRVVRLPLLRPFVAAHGATTTRDVVVVRALGDGAEGWGECAADTTPAYWYETVESAWSALLRTDLAAGAIPGVGHPMAKAALEMALLDRSLRIEGTSLATHLGASRAAVDATVTCGLDDDPHALLAAGYRSLKLKVAPGHRPSLDHGAVRVQVDANGTLDPTADAGYLDAIDGLGLLAIEQPFDPDDLLAHRDLCARLRTRVCLDESVTTPGAASTALALGAAGALCVKPSRLGGIAAARRVHDTCLAAAVDAKVGGMLETGIGRAAALALAALPGFTLPADLSAADRYWADDIVEEPARLDGDGRLPVPSAPGLGITVRLDAVEAATVQRTVLRAR